MARLDTAALLRKRSAVAARLQAYRSARQDYLREILKLNRAGMSYVEIAAELGVSKGRIQQLISEAQDV